MSRPDLSTDHDSASPSHSLPAVLRASLAADPRPVRPLRLGRALAIGLALFLAAGLTLLWSTFGLRADAEVLGGLWLWGLSGIELAVAASLLVLALREAIPGRGSSLAALAVLGTTALLVHGAAAVLTDLMSATPVPVGMTLRLAAVCFTAKLGLGLPMVLLALGLARRGLMVRPLRAGLWGGLGAGLLGDGVWRLICPYSELRHVLTAHGGGLVAVVASGALIAWFWQGRRARNWRFRRAGSRARGG